ncbi:hypothetical protein Acr_01g0006890 [Actinidia rufa]|uniref:Uncharacterized protein n=1 Tax=Actinidia rufa TaxID=165716 RepID=A0A7J0E395_9ERIC|nr:hypothetical protein Acr_01g0006890 [Actinidia rufa]
MKMNNTPCIKNDRWKNIAPPQRPQHRCASAQATKPEATPRLPLKPTAPHSAVAHAIVAATIAVSIAAVSSTVHLYTQVPSFSLRPIPFQNPNPPSQISIPNSLSLKRKDRIGLE